MEIEQTTDVAPEPEETPAIVVVAPEESENSVETRLAILEDKIVTLFNRLAILDEESEFIAERIEEIEAENDERDGDGPVDVGIDSGYTADGEEEERPSETHWFFRKRF